MKWCFAYERMKSIQSFLIAALLSHVWSVWLMDMSTEYGKGAFISLKLNSIQFNSGPM